MSTGNRFNLDSSKMLIKENRNDFLNPDPYTETDDADCIVLQRSVDYTCGVSNLLGNEYTVPANIVSLISVDYAAFNRRLQHARPKNRLTKGVFCRFGVLYPDVAFLPDSLNSQLHDTFSVEIKPKQGWTIDGLQNNEKCRYCCLQYLKVFQILFSHLFYYLENLRLLYSYKTMQSIFSVSSVP